MRSYNLSMFEVARRANISHATLSRGLRGVSNFEQKTIEAVSAVLAAEEQRLRGVLNGESAA